MSPWLWLITTGRPSAFREIEDVAGRIERVGGVTETALPGGGATGVGDDDEVRLGRHAEERERRLSRAGDRAVASGDACDVRAMEPVPGDLQITMANHGERVRCGQRGIDLRRPVLDAVVEPGRTRLSGLRHESLIPDGEDP